MAGGLAFSLLICVLPFTFLLFWILGNFLNSADVIIRVEGIIDMIVPYDAYANFAKSIVKGRIDELVSNKNLAGIVGLVSLLFAASGFFGSLRSALNTVFGERDELNIVVSKLFDFMLIFVVIVLFFASFLITPLIEMVKIVAMEFPLPDFFTGWFFENTFTFFVSFFLMLLLFAAFYRMVPTRKIRNRSMLVGAIFSAFLWVLAKYIFGIYITKFASFGKIYGTYALIIVLVFWIYYSSILFILGAEVARMYEENYELVKRKKSLFELKILTKWLDDNK